MVTTVAIEYTHFLSDHISGSLLRINLSTPNKLLGIYTSRGTRSANEDNYSAVSLELANTPQLLHMTKEANRVYFGIFDG